MDVLVIGTGGREHALVLALARDPGVADGARGPGQPRAWRRSRRSTTSTRWTAPPSPRLAARARRRAGRRRARGAAGRRASPTPSRAAGIPCFGPSAEAARLEGSKAFAKDVMAAAGVPTAAAHACTTPEEVAAALDEFGPPYVVKDDGLAAGKGVVVTDDRTAALRPRRGLRARGRRGVPRRSGGQPLRLCSWNSRRRDGLPAAARPGLQADLRRRRGTQHRRHGRLHPAALGARRPGRRGHRAPSCSRPSTRWRGAARRSRACCTPAWR